MYSERIFDPLLFHELVHVVQYQVLGLKRFASHYVRGFLSTRKYEDIPLERQAYELGERFERLPREAFSVLEEVLKWQNAAKF